MRLIDAEDACRNCESENVCTVRDRMMCVVGNAETIDAVPVVRCRDCKFAYAMDTEEFETFYFCEYADRSNAVDPMDFCSEGEKK